MEERVSQILSEAANALGMALGKGELSLFAAYYAELLAWNNKINLVSAKSERDIIIKHFIDSLTLLPYIKHETCRVLDIGSGAGFPGIPLKIAVNSLKVFLLESSRKKTSFLKHVIRSLRPHRHRGHPQPGRISDGRRNLQRFFSGRHIEGHI